MITLMRRKPAEETEKSQGDRLQISNSLLGRPIRLHPMKALLIVILLFQPFFVFGMDNPYSEETWLREGLAQQIPKFKRTTFRTHPEDKNITAINCETGLSWWGKARVLHHTGDKIDWIASFPASYLENCGDYVLSCEWRYLEKLQMWILEIFDSTHRGNGSLWLFALEGHDLRILLHTRAVDSHHEHAQRGQPPTAPASEVFRNGRLNVDYRVSEDIPQEAVYLTGTIVVLDDEDRELSIKPYTETWTWNAGKRIFTLMQP